MCCFFDRHKPRQIGCVGFIGRGRVRAPPILSRDTGRNRALVFFVAHRFHQQPDSQRETPAKRIVLAEVHDMDFHDNLFSLFYDAMFTYSLFTF